MLESLDHAKLSGFAGTAAPLAGRVKDASRSFGPALRAALDPASGPRAVSTRRPGAGNGTPPGRDPGTDYAGIGQVPRISLNAHTR
jgi:hypothetical protein